jgi:hypothetical protein
MASAVPIAALKKCAFRRWQQGAAAEAAEIVAG